VGRPLDVLIVDDDPMITRALARVIRRQHTVRVAEDLGQALALLQERTPDVVLCDFCMGDLTAAGFLRSVRVRWPGIRLVLHSASRAELWHELLTDGTIDRAVVKPASVPDLLASLHA
jgi:DNA-binding NtrC family response regulator